MEVDIQHADARKSFLRCIQRIRPKLPQKDISRIQFAYALAENHHGRATRIGEVDNEKKPRRFFHHPRQVALYLIERTNCNDADTICVALLHDAIEDTSLEPAIIQEYLGETVTYHVLTLTQGDTEEKKVYASRLVESAEWKPLLVKVCDILHNSETILACPNEMRKKFVHDVKKYYYPLLNYILGFVPDEFVQTVRQMYDEIRQNVMTCQSSLAA